MPRPMLGAFARLICNADFCTFAFGDGRKAFGALFPESARLATRLFLVSGVCFMSSIGSASSHTDWVWSSSSSPTPIFISSVSMVCFVRKVRRMPTFKYKNSKRRVMSLRRTKRPPFSMHRIA